jgi:hypothetical protein
MRLHVTLVPIVLVGCSLLPGADWDVRRGDIDEFSIPDTFRVGAATRVHVVTIGDGCSAKGPTGTSVNNSLAEIEPRDSIRRADVCTSIGKLYDHSVDITFQTAGAALVRLLGSTVVERSVTVR